MISTQLSLSVSATWKISNIKIYSKEYHIDTVSPQGIDTIDLETGESLTLIWKEIDEISRDPEGLWVKVAS